MKIKVSLVDAPADYESVLIDVVDVKINNGGWESLEGVENKVYDILKLTNGEEVILGEIELPEGQLQEIRLILGDNNLTFKTMSVTSSRTPLIEVNSCNTPSICKDVIADPCIEESKILLNEFPIVKA